MSRCAGLDPVDGSWLLPSGLLVVGSQIVVGAAVVVGALVRGGFGTGV
jgi:hypothetical protein